MLLARTSTRVLCWMIWLVHRSQNNATQAAIRAGYSEKTAYSQGQRLSKNVEVAEAIEAGKAARAVRTELTADAVIAELRKIGFSDIRKAVR